MLTIYFIRHGQTMWNKEGKFQGSQDSPLTDIGIEQANKLAAKFERENFIFDKVYSSPLGRAFKTAKLITKNRYEITPLEEFREISVGDMEGVDFHDFKSRFPDEYHNFFYSPVDYNPEKIDGESFLSLMTRIESGLNRIVTENSDESKVLVVTHGITLRGILSYIKNNGISLENFSKEEVPENTSITTIKFHEGKFSIEDFSNILHLEY